MPERGLDDASGREPGAHSRVTGAGEPGPDSPDPRVVAAMAGDRRAQSDLWRSHRPWLAAILLAHKPREMDIEDLMQDVAVKYVSKVHTLRDAGAFRPWLRRIAVNCAREHARGMKGQAAGGRAMVQEATEEQSFPPSRESGPVESSERRDEAKMLLRHALTLPPDYREPLLLSCIQGLTPGQIADTLELPRTTVETRLSRARRMLREEWLNRGSGVGGRGSGAKNTPTSNMAQIVPGLPGEGP